MSLVRRENFALIIVTAVITIFCYFYCIAEAGAFTSGIYSSNAYKTDNFFMLALAELTAPLVLPFALIVYYYLSSRKSEAPRAVVVAPKADEEALAPEEQPTNR